MNKTHPTRHISEFVCNGQNRRFLFTTNLRLFKPNTERDDGIYANSQTQNCRTANIWLAVTSSNAVFLRRIAESSQPNMSQTALQTIGCDRSVHKFIEVDFSKLTDNDQIFRNDFDYIHYHLCKISFQIIEFKIFASYDFHQINSPFAMV